MSSRSTDRKPRAILSPPVFFGAAALIIGFVGLGIIMPNASETFFGVLQGWILDTFGWFYVLSVAVILIFSVGVAISPLGRVKLGPDWSEPDYSYASWFSMLFAAGIGIGLMFYGVAEPLFHYIDPPLGEGRTVAAARDAMMLTFFHWGFNGWAIYAIVGASLAYFSFRHGLPLTIRSALHPLIGDRTAGPIGHAVDTFAVVATLFGITTSLGLGALQINTGLGYLFGTPETATVQVIIIAGITALATASVASGLDVGIRRLSEANVILAFLLLAFVILAGPTLFLLQAFVQNVGTYLSEIVGRTFQLYAYEPTEWLGNWTLFYWAWWIAWSPFVGMFIARISRGRTLREFTIGVLVVPFVVVAIWFTAFGDTAISFETAGNNAVSTAITGNTPLGLFVFLEQFPLSTLTSVVATVLIVIFFVTSADSGSLVIDTITAGGREDAPLWQRIFWAVLTGIVAAALLLTGGLVGLQTASLIAALPFTVVLLFMCFGLYRGLKRERGHPAVVTAPGRLAHGGEPIAWRRRLAHLLDYPPPGRVSGFIAEVVRPVLEEVGNELRGKGIDARVAEVDKGVALEVTAPDMEAFTYAVRCRSFDLPEFAYRDLPRPDLEGRRYARAEVRLRGGREAYDLMGMSRDQVIADVLTQYERHHARQAAA